MSSYWVNFITKGDPNGNGLPQWPEYKDLHGRQGDGVRRHAAGRAGQPAAKLQFYSAAYQRMLRSGTN